MEEKRKAPELRFPDFTDDWEKRKFRDILVTLPFKQYLKVPDVFGKYEVIQQGNNPVMGYANGIPCTNYEDTVIFGDHTLSLYKPDKPFFVATDGVRILKGNNGMNGNFLNVLLQKYKPASEGYKRYYSILADCDCMLTENHDEQKRIGAFFSTIDKAIALHQRKENLLRELKKGMLQKIFSQEIRFKDDNGQDFPDWEENILGNICVFINGDRSRNYPSTNDFVDNGIPFIGSNSLGEHDVNMSNIRFISELKYRNMKGIKIKTGDILYTLRGAGFGKSSIANFTDGTIASSLVGIRANAEKVTPEYLFQWMNSDSESMERYKAVSGSTAQNISVDDMKRYKIMLPSLSEQMKIARYFTHVDSLIATEQKKVSSLQTMKKGFLQKMFV